MVPATVVLTVVRGLLVGILSEVKLLDIGISLGVNVKVCSSDETKKSGKTKTVAPLDKVLPGHADKDGKH